MPALLGSKDFASHLHTTFRVEEPFALDLELVEVNDLSSGQFEQFSVCFAGPASPWLQQGTYTLKHERMAELSLFMGPKGPHDGRMVYEASFTRLIEPAAGNPAVNPPEAKK